MGKKAKEKRIANYEAFMEGMIKYRGKFMDQKIALIEKILTDKGLDDTLMKKDRKELTKLERAAIDTIKSRDIKSLEQFQEIKDEMKESKITKAKFKYQPKVI